MIDALATIERLEIRLGELAHKIDACREADTALSERLCALAGRALGGGKGRPRHSTGNGQLDLESIPKGDKAGLRAYFKINPPKEDN